MVTLLAPKAKNLYTGGYLYNQRITRELSGDGFSYILLPDPPPSLEDLEKSGVDSDSALLLDSLYFQSPGWVEKLLRSRSSPVGMLVHYLPSLEPFIQKRETQKRFEAEGRCLEGCGRIAAASAHTAANIKEFFIKAAVPGVFSPGTDVPGVEDCRNDLAQDGRNNRREIILLTVANWTLPKNHLFLIQVLKNLAYLPWQWKIFGFGEDSPSAHDFRQKARREGILSRIQICGAVEPGRVRAEMLGADLYVSPSIFESYGMTIAEALAASLPVAANRTGGIPEVTGDSSGARLCTPGDTGEWTFVLRELMESPGLRGQMRAAALKRARELPSWSSTARTLLDHMEQR